MAAASPCISAPASSSSPPPPTPQPMYGLLLASTPPPFLTKTYDLVDDPSTDQIISWSSTNNSFIVWDSYEYSRAILPKFFKHNNFSSFVRQLNTYVDTDRWEFANEAFLRGQKHLLKNIRRRKGPSQHEFQQQLFQASVALANVQGASSGIANDEVERLTSDRKRLMLEVAKLRQQQQATQQELRAMAERLQATEQKQQQLMTFLAKAVHNSTFMAHMAHETALGKELLAMKKKRKLPTTMDTCIEPSPTQLTPTGGKGTCDISPTETDDTCLSQYLCSELAVSAQLPVDGESPGEWEETEDEGDSVVEEAAVVVCTETVDSFCNQDLRFFNPPGLQNLEQQMHSKVPAKQEGHILEKMQSEELFDFGEDDPLWEDFLNAATTSIEGESLIEFEETETKPK